MTTVTLAVYENGVLRPARPLPYAEGETVQLTVTRPLDPAEVERRMRAAKTLRELFDAFEAAPDEDDGYDLLKALDENRKGERPLFPPELKGISW
jgi:predicted DNA-binding antitoxin AbrB/MazE fold protein